MESTVIKGLEFHANSRRTKSFVVRDMGREKVPSRFLWKCVSSVFEFYYVRDVVPELHSCIRTVTVDTCRSNHGICNKIRRFLSDDRFLKRETLSNRFWCNLLSTCSYLLRHTCY